MKSLVMSLLFIVCAAHAGIGGMQGGHVTFQRESTFVSPLFSKSLCFDGSDFHAEVRKCAKWSTDDERGCERYEKVKAVQPMVSTRQRCDRFGGHDDNRCDKWITVPFIQDPVRTVDVVEDDQVVKKVKVRVRDCNALFK